MDIDSAIARYTAHPEVARWLFSSEDVKTVSAKALDNSFVYAIGFGAYDAGTPRTMNIEDMYVDMHSVRSTPICVRVPFSSVTHAYPTTFLRTGSLSLARSAASSSESFGGSHNPTCLREPRLCLITNRYLVALP